jgi:hypothetical protein
MSKSPQGQKPETLDTRTQGQKFIDTARALGCNEDEAAFDAELRRVARVKTEAGKLNRGE